MDQFSKFDSTLAQANNVHDIQGLDALRKAAKGGDDKALVAAAKQFEAIFVQMMLKSMRQAEDVMADDDNPMNSQQVKFYRGMHDQQLASDLADKGSIGLAEIIVRQLGQKTEGYTPSNVLRDDGNLSSINRSLSSSVAHAQDLVLGRSSKRAMFDSPEQFISELMPIAKKAVENTQIDPLAMVAQAAVETGWGQHMIQSGTGKNSHNLFGIKADHRWQGEKALVETLEYKQGLPEKQKAHFRAYDNFNDSMRDYVSFVKDSPRYSEALKNAANPQQYFDSLQQAGYATDPNYAKKVLSVMKGDTFARFLLSNETRAD